MGSFFTNLHVKCDEIVDSVALVKRLRLGPTYISNIEDGWLSIFPQKTEEQDANQLAKICAKVSKRFASPVLAFLVHDSAIFIYFFADAGRIVDSYNSAPRFFEEEEESDGPVGGDTSIILPLCLPGTKEELLTGLLRDHVFPQEPKSAEERAEVELEVNRQKKEMIDKYAHMGNVPPERIKEAVPDIDEMLWYLERDVRIACGDSDDLTTADDIAIKLAKLLGIPEWRVQLGYNYIEQGEGEDHVLTEIIAESDILTVNPNEKGWAQCPKCQFKFSTADARVFDGKRHKSCGQRLTVMSQHQPANS